MGQLIAIVGRPNVGKSTLFNRLTESRTAIVDETAGTTRDRQYGKVNWNGKEFSIVDTGGWVVNSEDIFEGEINKQVALAIEQADEILFVVELERNLYGQCYFACRRFEQLCQRQPFWLLPFGIGRMDHY